jgi:peptidoglycan DL-endopeptidase CwlO
VAIRLSRRVLPLGPAALAIGAAVVVPTIASATPDSPTPASVQQQLDTLSVKNSQLVEKFDQAQVAVTEYDKKAKAAQHAADKANAAYHAALALLSSTITAEYENGSFSATGALFTSDSGASYVERLNTLSLMNQHTSGVLTRIAASEKSASKATHDAKALLKTAQAKRNALAKHKAEVQKQIDKYRNLLATLTAAQQTAFQQTQNPQVTTPVAPQVYAGGTAAAQKAVKFALAQVGKPYVFGAAGPDAYDCSGLTMASWASAGVGLPHSAADQYNYGRHVSINSLQPGDLVFFYQPIGHVTIYIGGGLMVSAPQSGENVSVVPLSSFTGDITGATRLT